MIKEFFGFDGYDRCLIFSGLFLVGYFNKIRCCFFLRWCLCVVIDRKFVILIIYWYILGGESFILLVCFWLIRLEEFVIFVKSGFLFLLENCVLLICIWGLVFLYEIVNIVNFIVFVDIFKKLEVWYVILFRVSVFSFLNFIFF